MDEKSIKFFFEMKGIVCDFLASKLHSVSLCRAFCYLGSKIWTHQKLNFKCFCYKCRFKELSFCQ